MNKKWSKNKWRRQKCIYIFFFSFGFVFMFDLLVNFTSLFLLSLPACLWSHKIPEFDLENGMDLLIKGGEDAARCCRTTLWFRLTSHAGGTLWKSCKVPHSSWSFNGITVHRAFTWPSLLFFSQGEWAAYLPRCVRSACVKQNMVSMVNISAQSNSWVRVSHDGGDGAWVPSPLVGLS